MNILFYDTETTGLPKNWKAHVHEVDNWPRLVQLAWVLVDSDTRAVLASTDQLIKPSGKWEMSPQAEKTHGLSEAHLDANGMTIDYVLGQFMFALQLSQVQVGHNISYDWKIMGAEVLRGGLEDQYGLIKDGPKICTMMSWTKAKGGKWPQLQELHQKLFGEKFEDAHDATADINATINCYFKMDELGMIVRPPALMGE